MRILALGGVAGPIVFGVAVVVAASLRPGYSHAANMISELGAQGTPYAGLMNYAGFVPSGLLLAAFGVALAGALPPHRFPRAATVLVMLFGIGIVAAGVFSCDAGCPQSTGTLDNRIHDRIAPATFVSLIVAAGMLGFRFRRLADWRDLAGYSLLTSAVALILLIVLASSLQSRVLTGLWQRLMLTSMFLWCAIVGVRAYSLGRRPRRIATP
jgi:hypothetical membrane protein